MANSYLEKLKAQKAAKANSGGNGKKRPRAFYQKVPYFTIPEKRAHLYIGKYEVCPIEPDDPSWNDSDEHNISYRFHYFPNGVMGLSGRKEWYVYCPRSINQEERCAFCEVYRATWQIKLMKMDDKNKEKKSLRDQVAAYRPQTKTVFPILNLSLLEKKAPDCFTVQGQLDPETEKCKTCAWQDACFRGGVGVEIYATGPTIKSHFDTHIEGLAGIQSEEQPDSDDEPDDDETDYSKYQYEGEYYDMNNAVTFKLTKKKKGEKIETELKLGEVGYKLKPEWQKIWSKTMPQNLEVLFEQTHTYEQMLDIIPDDLREYLEEWFSENGIEYPDDGKKKKKDKIKIKKSSKVVVEEDEDEDEPSTSEDEEDEDGDESDSDEESEKEDEDDEEESKPSKGSSGGSSRRKPEQRKGVRDVSKESEEDDDSGEDDADSEDDEASPKKTSSSDNSKTGSSSKAVSKKNNSDDTSSAIKVCFADESVFDPSVRECFKCPLFDQCGDVIDGTLTKEAAIKLLTADSDTKKPESKPKVKAALKLKK